MNDPLKYFAEAFVSRFQEATLIRKFVENTDVLGAYYEELVRERVQSILSLHRISTGAIITPVEIPIHDAAQIDTIVWSPLAMPAIFDSGRFALVPSESVRGIIEIKGSSSSIPKLREQIDKQRAPLSASYRRHAIGVVIRHQTNIPLGFELRREWTHPDVLKTTEPIVLNLFKDEGDQFVPNHEAIMAFAFFLAELSAKL